MVLARQWKRNAASAIILRRSPFTIECPRVARGYAHGVQIRENASAISRSDYYLSRMSFLTDVTPWTARVTSTAVLMLAWELTKPLS